MSMTSSGTATAALHEARFSDGSSARSRPVRVRLAADGIEIFTDEHAGATSVWPYAGIRSGVPVSAHAIDVSLSSATHPDASLFVPGATFVGELLRHMPRLAARRQRWRAARPWLAASLGMIVGVAGAVMLDLSPVRAVASLLPDGARTRLGEQAIRSMVGDKKKCEAAPGKAALAALSSRLTTAAGEAARFEITVADWGLVNAFAAPGEKIVLTRGIIERAESADELAGVLAHEMGHGLERHPERSIVRALGLAALTDLMLGGSGGAMSNVGLLLAQVSYTREAELSADDQALRLLREAKISPAGVAAFFRRTAQKEGDKAPGPLGMLRTHPLSLERAARAEAQAAYPATAALDAEQWAALREICGPKPAPKPPATAPAGPVTVPAPPVKPAPKVAPKTFSAPPAPKATQPPPAAKPAAKSKPLPPTPSKPLSIPE